ncbi:AfsR/SARP family transcriptional regulator [Streptomyces sp. KN37]|uniref:AfsR/SARP family transcriptional regulator n=1 Tax=Streptomyces sp. KN37 TaxID=3090667 RepID=UPI002A76567F|nr:BTAD domain-containing putative transcriptional regulator [Streptomyces sp. KN37]WPO75612.1 BTAD domain-containing putative transcriptional regulator [Streptomyces sp. KN37]
MDTDMHFRLLGPVEAWREGRRLALGGPKPRALLAALLLEPGRVVSADALIDAIWGDRPPDTARSLIQSYVSALRRALSPDVIETQPPGYLIHADADVVDRAAFERLTAQGRQAAAAGDHAGAARLLSEALALWRGPALGGIGETLRAMADQLEEARQAALEERIAADLAQAGRETELVAELTALVATHPTRERLRGQLMLALYRLGRQADALAVYAEGRDVLAEELGIDPGPGLRAMHEAILRGDEELLPTPRSAPAAGDAPAAAGERPRAHDVGPALASPAPALLPPAIGDFTGREAQLSEIRAALTDTGTGAGTGAREAMPVVAVTGPGGVGKSVLGVTAAHRVADAYPDGQLYAELRGATDPVAPGEVLGRLLRALGADPPEGDAERRDLFRSLVAGRRVLLVLDDAGSESQVRPLLPGSATCGVLITARPRLAALPCTHRTDLDVLDTERGADLLARVAGERRVRDEPDAVRRIVELCGGLPLALRIAGARLATRRHWTARTLAERLADERHRLDELAVGDLEVRAGLSLSYQALDAPARTALRRLGLLAAPDVASWVVAALLDVSETEAERVVEQLIDAQLLHCTVVDRAGQPRYRPHDLVQVYAAERAEAEDSPAERSAAVGRALGAGLWLTGRVASATPSGAVELHRGFLDSGGPVSAASDAMRRLVRPVGPEATRRALADPSAWFEAEADAFAAAVERAAAYDLHTLACEAAAALCSSAYAVGNRFEAWWRSHDAALAAARRAEDHSGEALLLIGLGQLRYEQDRFAESQEYFRQAAGLCAELSDARGRAAALAGLGSALREAGRLRAALDVLIQAVEGFRGLHDDPGLGLSCRFAGTVHLELGEHREAFDLLDESLRAYRRLGSRRGEALTVRSLSLVHRALGAYEEAERLADEAVGLLRVIGDPLMSAYAVQARAKCRFRLGRCEEAAADLRDVLDTCRSHHDRFGEALALRTLGECELAVGRSGTAEKHLTAAAAFWAALELPLPRARTLRDLAAAREAAGDREQALALRAEAREVFTAYEARERDEPGI